MSANQLEQPDCAQRQAHAKRSAQKSQQQTFGGNLPEKRQAADSQGAAHRVFLLPLQPAHQQQGGGIPASDQKHERSRAQERQQDAAAVAIEFGGQRLNLGE